jgi:hypothetical protein
LQGQIKGSRALLLGGRGRKRGGVRREEVLGGRRCWEGGSEKVLGGRREGGVRREEVLGGRRC